MDIDLMLVIGITLVVLTIPSMVSAFSDGRAPRFAALVLLIGGTLLVIALNGKPSGYQPAEIFGSFGKVFNRYVW
jgi:hypothetical protein